MTSNAGRGRDDTRDGLGRVPRSQASFGISDAGPAEETQAT
jgi:hypothetical protein